jgi:phenylacetate-CoA ligase
VADIFIRARWSAYTLWQARGDEDLPFAPFDRIVEAQSRKVRAMVRHAYDTVPHYRDAIDAVGLAPDDFRCADDLARLPIVGGDALAAAPERFASTRYPDSQTLALHSSGTGGRAKVVRYTADALFSALAHGRRQRAVFAHFLDRRRSGYREMRAHRSESVGHQLRRFYEANAWVPRALDLQRADVAVEASFEEARSAINAFRPEVFSGYGSYVGALYRWAFERNLELHAPRIAWYGADRMADADRDLLERKLGIAVISTYQADEALRLAFQCEHRRGFHLSLDDVAVRVVDARGRSVGPGESGEIVISNLTNRATVLLNYKLGDVVTTSAEVCPCGRSLPTIERIEGRADDLLLLPGGDSMHPLGIVRHLQAVSGVVRVQLVQEELRRIAVRVICAADAEWLTVRSSLERILQERLGAGLAIECERVDVVSVEPGGKVRAVISRCKRAG